MSLRTVLAAAATAACLFSVAAPAQAWELIGTKQADHLRDRDVITVRGRDRHRAVRICVSRAPLAMQRMRIVFRNGGSQDVALRNLFVPGTCSRAIDLRGNRRDIRRIAMVYSKFLPGRAPVVRVYAR